MLRPRRVPPLPSLLLWIGLIGACCTPASANPLPAGACCLPSGECVMTDDDGCSILGGFWAFSWMCEANPCPPNVGACCSPNGQCLVATVVHCLGDLHWNWLGPNATTCNPNPCPDCFLPCGSGVCCFGDGHCEVINQITCMSLSGSYQGIGACEPNPCGAFSGIGSEGSVLRENWGMLKQRFR